MAQTESEAARLCVAEEQEPHREIHNLALSFGDQGTRLDVLGVSTKVSGAHRGLYYTGTVDIGPTAS